MQMSSLLSLPSEVLHEILKHLDCRDLLTCSLVCRQLDRTIKTGSELLYAIELRKNGMIDNGCSSTSYAERLTLLRERCRAWRKLEWKKVVRIGVDGPCIAYELVGGVFAKTSGRDLFLAWLPSAEAPGYVIHHQELGLTLRDFAIDPTQDLAVLLEEDSTLFQDDWSRNVWLRLRTMSTMKPHPTAQLPDLCFTICDLPNANRIASALVQTMSDVLAVFLSMGFQTTRLVIWNWREGRLLCDLGDEDMHPASWDLALISPRSFMITSNQDEGAILLYKFPHTRATWPIHVATLHMPPLKEDHAVAFLSSHSGPFLAGAPQGTTFTTAPDSRIQVITACYQDRRAPFGGTKCYYFYIHNKTLQQYVEQHGNWSEEEDGMAVEPIDIPWEQWGPKNCHFNLVRSQTHWLRYVHGSRAVCPPELRNGESTMQVWDFNVLPGEQERRADCPPMSSDRAAAAACPFRDEIKTYLPHHAERRVVRAAYKAYMIDEERVIGLKASAANDGDIESLHVYCF